MGRFVEVKTLEEADLLHAAGLLYYEFCRSGPRPYTQDRRSPSTYWVFIGPTKHKVGTPYVYVED